MIIHYIIINGTYLLKTQYFKSASLYFNNWYTLRDLGILQVWSKYLEHKPINSNTDIINVECVQKTISREKKIQAHF